MLPSCAIYETEHTSHAFAPPRLCSQAPTDDTSNYKLLFQIKQQQVSHAGQENAGEKGRERKRRRKEERERV